MPLPQQWNYSVAQASLAPPASVPERYAMLYWYSAGTNGVAATSSGSAFLAKGGATSNPATQSACQLYTLNSQWPSSTKFAFEHTMSAGSGLTAYAALWDVTTNAIVSPSQISTTSTTMTTVRSAQLTLVPGHTYAVTVWGTGNPSNHNDASLIIFS